MGRQNNKEIVEKVHIKASFTVEAAVIVPIILFTIVGGINIGYDMFSQAKAASEVHEELDKLNPVEIVRRNTLIENF